MWKNRGRVIIMVARRYGGFGMGVCGLRKGGLGYLKRHGLVLVLWSLEDGFLIERFQMVKALGYKGKMALVLVCYPDSQTYERAHCQLAAETLFCIMKAYTILPVYHRSHLLLDPVHHRTCASCPKAV